MTDPTFHYDVLVIGTGNAACCAALAALDHKVRVGVIEKATQRDRGGNAGAAGEEIQRLLQHRDRGIEQRWQEQHHDHQDRAHHSGREGE